ncbi:hypothetical protein DRW41_00405 [Neobacillus piezotolerans]|uniref:Uncharacterized protein n=1 Tax=Neobacillus piezotolerans TaxID=2259171 RepID=A0A3D8GUM9_9BACI|nr:hypothetical protein [Neobacillus piezotolerans]RDU38072.1 hypothetical protein DRW41_00405 [Neobacillus piezotolerans]
MTGSIAAFMVLVPVVMIFSIPITAIITSHIRKQSQITAGMVKDQLELEKLKHENYLIETEKMRLELEKTLLNNPKDETRFI